MEVKREALLGVLRVAGSGAAMPPRIVLLEQSDCFLFTGEELITFNDEIKVSVKSPLKVEKPFAVSAAGLLNLFKNFPDETVKVKITDTHVLISAGRRRAGLQHHADLLLPYQDVPKAPKKWRKMSSVVWGMIRQASRVCGKDMTNVLTTAIHLAPDRIEATDNFRAFRCCMKTNFKTSVLLPATSFRAMEQHNVTKFALTEGWLHLKTANGCALAVRAIMDSYVDLDPVMEQANGNKVTLPSNLSEIVSRASALREGNTNWMDLERTCSQGKTPSVNLTISKKKISLESRNEIGWYTESSRTSYKGPVLKFDVHPKFLVEILALQKKFGAEKHVVSIGDGKMIIDAGPCQFACVLEVPESEED